MSVLKALNLEEPQIIAAKSENPIPLPILEAEFDKLHFGLEEVEFMPWLLANLPQSGSGIPEKLEQQIELNFPRTDGSFSKRMAKFFEVVRDKKLCAKEVSHG